MCNSKAFDARPKRIRNFVKLGQKQSSTANSFHWINYRVEDVRLNYQLRIHETRNTKKQQQKVDAWRTVITPYNYYIFSILRIHLMSNNFVFAMKKISQD